MGNGRFLRNTSDTRAKEKGAETRVERGGSHSTHTRIVPGSPSILSIAHEPMARWTHPRRACMHGKRDGRNPMDAELGWNAMDVQRVERKTHERGVRPGGIATLVHACVWGQEIVPKERNTRKGTIHPFPSHASTGHVQIQSRCACKPLFSLGRRTAPRSNHGSLFLIASSETPHQYDSKARCDLLFQAFGGILPP